MPHIEDIKESEDRGIHGKTFTHPAFGQIRCNRVQGSKTALYGSDFDHGHYVIVEISHSALVRSLNRDRYHEREPITRVAMSEAQWAAFVSSMGHQSVPCTIERIGLEGMPSLPLPTVRVDQFMGEMEGKLGKVLAGLDEAIAGAKTKAQAHQLQGIKQELTANLDFITRSFDEHMEGTVEKAKAEVHGYMHHTLQRLGLDAAGGTPFSLEGQATRALEDQSGSAE